MKSARHIRIGLDPKHVAFTYCGLSGKEIVAVANGTELSAEHL